jgi:xylose isomerase
MPVVIGETEYFPGVGRITYEGADSDNPLSFKYYDENRVVAGRRMKDFFKFATCYWHSFCGTGADPFGPGTQRRAWLEGRDAMTRARRKMDAAFEFFTKIGTPYYTFHDIDLVEEGDSRAETSARLQAMVDFAKQKMADSGMKVLWGTANLFSHPRYMNGASTNPDFRVVAFAGAQLKDALDATIALSGENYVFWGGREGYMSLLNTDMKREQEHLARFLAMAATMRARAASRGRSSYEPKPMEPVQAPSTISTPPP